MATADVTILGAGVMGLTTAYCCAVRGARVRVIDPHGVASGASGGIVGALAPHTPDLWDEKKQFQFESLILSRAFWPGVEAISNLPTGYTNAGRIQPILQERHVALAESRRVDAQTNWHGQADWDVMSVKSQGDWAPPSPTGQVIKDTLAAHIHPRQATQSLAVAVQELGGVITTAGARQGRIVDATGWTGLLEMSQQLGVEVGNGVKGQAALLDFDAVGRPQLFADGLHVVPHHDNTVAIGSTSERYFKAPDQPDQQLDDIIARAKRLFPILADAPVIERWAGVRPRAWSRAPLLGAHPTQADWFVVNGGFKIGFGMAPKIGHIMADLILDGVDHIPAGFKFSHMAATK
ncbi:MAG: NAD(P)/FAD-dependent oxidoreductase [Planktomarina sp.]